MYVKNKSIVDGKEVEIETKISVKYESEDDLTKIAKDYIARVEKMRDYVLHPIMTAGTSGLSYPYHARVEIDVIVYDDQFG